ncbi:MAG: gluconolactonase [Opitutia bacterium]|nr:SMP-30/gluconolactonase/LRE family protein [Opitutaceae bacterium]PHX85830.1 MAG: gluconolactonase [Opitutae bacterium]
MKNFLCFLAVFPFAVFAAATSPLPTVGTIERLDPAFDALIAVDAKLEKLAEGFKWSEGPVWYEGAVVFSDVPQNIAFRWKEGMTAAEVFLKPSGLLNPTPGFREQGSNGLALDLKGKLLLCQHGERQVSRYENGKFTPLATRFDGKRFNSPNDLALRRNGDIYFTDPSYGLEKGNDSPLKELPFNGVYRLTLDGKVTLLTKSINFPNGIAFSPDEKVLYVAVSDGKAPRIMVYDVTADGGIAGERVFFDALALKTAGGKGSCDGLKIDRAGNLWATGPGGVLVISPTGKHLGTLATGVPTANCGWGDDGSTLYITANNMLLRVKTRIKGAGW